MKVRLENIRDFHLDHIFDCGQCFRWNREEDGSYTGVALGRAVNMAFYEDEPGGFCGSLVIDHTTEEEARTLWRPYLDLDRDYGRIKEWLAADTVMAGAISRGQGIRILRQERWETLVSFLLSQNNNIPRIKKSVEALCRLFGPALGRYRGMRRWGFPSAETLAGLSEADLAECRLGYRARYLLATAREVAKDGGFRLEAACEEGGGAACAYLRSLPGVGPKVADCVLLFSMEQRNRFPIDVWVRRAMHQLYGFEEKDERGMAAFAERMFGEYGGLAQQYLFYSMKTGKEPAIRNRNGVRREKNSRQGAGQKIKTK